MTTRVGATEAARTLGVTKPTLYAYVSRGLLSRTVAVDGRTSLYDRAEIEALAHRSRRSAPVERPSIDVQITTGITQLHDDSPTYRGHRVVDLVETHRFEQVADLLLTGELGGDRHHWQIDRAALDRSMRIATAAAPCDPITTLSMTALSLGDRSPDDRSPDDRSPDDVASVARALIMLAPSVLGGAATRGHRRPPRPALGPPTERRTRRCDLVCAGPAR